MSTTVAKQKKGKPSFLHQAPSDSMGGKPPSHTQSHRSQSDYPGKISGELISDWEDAS